MRRHLDKYFTPETAALELLKRVNIAGTVLECCVGTGTIANGLDASSLIEDIYGNDIDPLYAVSNFDVSVWESWYKLPRSDWVITNPPFSQANEIVGHAFEHARIGIAMLLRKTFTEPTLGRQDWLIAHRPHFAHQIFLPRISFTGDGKVDNVACDWYVWTKQRVSGCAVDWVRKTPYARVAQP